MNIKTLQFEVRFQIDDVDLVKADGEGCQDCPD